ncbi:MAG TPA: hypothetical protein VL053_18155, partial [Arachidicoccus sp.]|nr:hypothetical protein [Arachidicoccus sp.]
FNRYNLLAFDHDRFNVSSQKVEDYDIILIGPFNDYEVAKTYQQQIRPVTAGTILPWLTPEKYRFILISPQNADKLKSDADLTNYEAAWKQFEAK